MENSENKTKIKKNQTYERIGILNIEEVIPVIQEHFDVYGNKGKVDISGFYVNVQSVRLRTFAHTGTSCECCGIKAEYFAVERSPGNPKAGYHLNLWGHDDEGNDVLFTHDHILARALGGKDDLTNTETMCGPCNWEKGKIEQKILLFPENRADSLAELHAFKETKAQLKLSRQHTMFNEAITKPKMR
jgi:hypothetical protein